MATINHSSVKRIGKWVHEQLAAHTLGEREEPVIAFSIAHVDGGMNEKEVHTLKLGGKEWSGEEVVKVLYEKAYSHASEMAGGSGVQQYVILAHADGVESPVANHPIKISGDSDIGYSGTEPATDKGVLSQMMRLMESATRMALESVGRQNAQLMESNLRLMDRFDSVAQKHFDVVTLAEAVVMKAAEGEHARAIEIHKLEQMAELRKTAMQFLPHAINKISGTEIFPTSAMDTKIIESFAEAIKPEHIPMLQQFFTPEQWVVIVDRIMPIVEAKEKERRNKITKVEEKNGAS